MRLSFVFIFIIYISCQAQTSLKFASGDSILFNVKSYGCYSKPAMKQLLLVRNGECVTLTKMYSDPDHIIPVITDRININWNFLKDTLSMKLKLINKMEEELSTEHTLLYVLNNGKPITIKLKTLRVLEKDKKSVSSCIYEGYEAHIFLDNFYNSLEKGFKTTVKASCNYKPKQKMPSQGEN